MDDEEGGEDEDEDEDVGGELPPGIRFVVEEAGHEEEEAPDMAIEVSEFSAKILSCIHASHIITHPHHLSLLLPDLLRSHRLSLRRSYQPKGSNSDVNRRW